MLTIIDTGIANVGSIKYKLFNHGIDSQIATTGLEIKEATKIILPGVGHFKEGMKRLERNGMADILVDKVKNEKVPIFAICLGMQLLTTKSEEGNCKGLGLIDAETVKFNFSDKSLKIPHVGWNKLSFKTNNALFKNIEPINSYYFTHSYYVKCNNEKDILTSTNYGHDFVSAVNRENIYGTQFHPEKSHRKGFQILINFVKEI